MPLGSPKLGHSHEFGYWGRSVAALFEAIILQRGKVALEGGAYPRIPQRSESLMRITRARTVLALRTSAACASGLR